MIQITSKLLDLVVEIRRQFELVGSPVIEEKTMKTGETQIRFVVKLRPKPKEKVDDIKT